MDMAVKAFILVVVCVWSIPVLSQDCSQQLLCSDCINMQGCAWCSQEPLPFMGPRCYLQSNGTTCGQQYIQNPTSSVGNGVVNTRSENRTISFDRIRVKLRVGDPASFVVSVTPQRNLPLDLYILIDLSDSMEAELNTVQRIASEIANRVGIVTNNTRLGFGSFIEKPIEPYASQRLDGSLDGTQAGLYSFRHSITLTGNETDFANRLNNISNIIPNSDVPESGLDGLAQVITCEDIIGWRERQDGIGTRLILFMTDEEFHYAGEGRLAGILKPYNGECLLVPNSNGGPVDYTRSTEFDYPSVGQILQLLSNFDVTAIFAIEERRIQGYRTLVDDILNAANFERAAVEGFNIDSAANNDVAEERILEIIGSQYERLLQSVSLDFTEVLNGEGVSVRVDLQPSCPNNIDPVEGRCLNVPLESRVNFTVTLTLNSCDGLENGQVISRRVTAPSFGTFLLEMEVICDCECAADAMRVDGNCSNSGERNCGVCKCDEGKCGAECNRVADNLNGTDCPVGGLDGLVCSGPTRGMCDCTCICLDGFFGEACECDRVTCPGTPACSGQGDCCNGRCICHSNDQGQFRGREGQINICECQPAESVCIDPTNNRTCNDRGNCGCNHCECTDPNYTGIFCDLPNIGTCGFAQDLQCIEQCRNLFDEQNLPDICDCVPSRPVLFVNRDEIASSLTRSLEDITTLRLGSSFVFLRGACNFEEDNCITEYYILENNTHFAIVAVRELDCSSSSLALAIPVWALAPIILGCLLILGILLVILIKIIFTILDYIEVKRWQREAQGADFSKNTNPLYQSPEMKYENVAYGKE